MKRTFYFILLTATLAACGNQAEKPEDPSAEGAYFPVLSYLKGQVATIDTSLYTIMQFKKSGSQTDTVYIRREDFKNVAAPFTQMPDITGSKLKKKYTESRLYDETLDRFIITYTPAEPDEVLEVTRQDIVITPNTGDGDQVESIYIERVVEAGDSTVQMKMNWEVAKGFTIRSIIQKKDSPEKLQSTEVVWSNPRSAAKL